MARDMRLNLQTILRNQSASPTNRRRKNQRSSRSEAEAECPVQLRQPMPMPDVSLARWVGLAMRLPFCDHRWNRLQLDVQNSRA